jgi:hypothetical protein
VGESWRWHWLLPAQRDRVGVRRRDVAGELPLPRASMIVMTLRRLVVFGLSTWPVLRPLEVVYELPRSVFVRGLRDRSSSSPVVPTTAQSFSAPMVARLSGAHPVPRFVVARSWCGRSLDRPNVSGRRREWRSRPRVSRCAVSMYSSGVQLRRQLQPAGPDCPAAV